MVERAACGVTVPPEDGPALAGRSAAWRPTARRPAGWASAAAATRVTHYDRAALAARFVETVESLA